MSIDLDIQLKCCTVSLVVAEPNAETIANFAKWMQKENVKSKVNLEPFSGAGYGGVANVELKVIFNNPISFVNYQTYFYFQTAK